MTYKSVYSGTIHVGPHYILSNLHSLSLVWLLIELLIEARNKRDRYQHCYRQWLYQE